MKNRLIEFPFWDKEFMKFLILKTIAFIVDLLIVLSLLFLLFMVGIPSDFINSLLYFMLLGIGYNMIIILAFKRTIGMIVTGLYIVNKTGYFISTYEIFSRAFLNAFYTLPFIGLVAIMVNCLIPLMYKGISIIDFMSRTITVSRGTYLQLINDEKAFLDQKNKEDHE